MRCSSYCTANSYDINRLVNHLTENGFEPKHFDDVIYVQKEIYDSYIDIFFFPFGCITIWGSDELQEKVTLDILQVCEIVPVRPLISDLIYFEYAEQEGSKTFIDEEKNEIILADNSSFIKLSVSYALAQSVKLNLLEKSVSDLLNRATPIQQELASSGTVSLSKKDLSKQIGILFNERYSINLHSDILDTPEFFWRRPRYEHLYLTTAAFQDIQVRRDILNHRLAMIHELYALLTNELNYKHSTRLEVIIIVLIAIEVFLALMHNDTVINLLAKILKIFAI